MINSKKQVLENVLNYWTQQANLSLRKTAAFQTYQKNLDEKITAYLDAIILNSSYDFLKRDFTDTPSSYLTREAESIFYLSLGYVSPGSSYYQQEEILALLKGMLTSFFTEYEGKTHYGNWWDWQIGVPNFLCPSFVFLKEAIEPIDLQKYLAVLSAYVPDALKQFFTVSQNEKHDLKVVGHSVSTGANRIDLAYIVFLIGLLQEDYEKAQLALAATEEVFADVTKDDGFYPDGSMIQHHSIPYNGSYGAVVMERSAQFYPLLDNTDFEISQELKNRLGELVLKSYLPFLHEGEILAGVRGRGISREEKKHQEFGSMLVVDLLYLSRIFVEKTQQEIKENLTPAFVHHENFYFKNLRSLSDLAVVLEGMTGSNQREKSKKALTFHYYPAMDRFVGKVGSTTSALSLYSKRISALEMGNGENLKGWHTGDGFLALYQKGQNFIYEYWPTVDFTRLPGTTIDPHAKKPEVLNFDECQGIEDFVGGICGEKFAAIAFSFDKNHYRQKEIKGNDLLGKKSYFFYENQIYCLGAGITGTSSAGIETVLENRLLNPEEKAKIKRSFTENEGPFKAGDWLHLEDGWSQLGYVLLENSGGRLRQETRNGTYREINLRSNGETTYEGTYLTWTLAHGKAPKNASYGYGMVLETPYEKFLEAKENLPEILQNTEKVQALYFREENLTLACVYAETAGFSVAGVKLLTPAVISVKEFSGGCYVWLANPTQNGEAIVIDLEKGRNWQLTNGEDADGKVTLKDNQLIVETSGDEGKTWFVTLKC